MYLYFSRPYLHGLPSTWFGSGNAQPIRTPTCHGGLFPGAARRHVLGNIQSSSNARASYGLQVLQIGQTAVEGSLLPLLWSHDPSLAIARYYVLTDAAIPKPRFALDVYRLAHNDALIPWIFLFLLPLSLLRGRYRSLQLAAHDLVDVEVGRPY